MRGGPACYIVQVDRRTHQMFENYTNDELHEFYELATRQAEDTDVWDVVAQCEDELYRRGLL